MGLNNLTYEEGQTPLAEEEKEGLLIPSVTTKGELDEVEQRNIEEAIRWTLSRRKMFTAPEILTEPFLLDLHRRMLGEVWKWAGTFRKTDKNIGISKYDIGVGLRTLLGDCRYWIEHSTFEGEEIAIRFKHRLVSIHCFPNGNGRHSRLMADLIVEKVFGLEPFSWGGNLLTSTSAVRSAYIFALREADQGNYAPLISFARS